MAALTQTKSRRISSETNGMFEVAAGQTVYAGSFVGLDTTVKNTCRPISGATYSFLGIALDSGSAGERINVSTSGVIVETVAGSPDLNAVVNATDDDTLTTAVGAKVGTVANSDGSKWAVAYESAGRAAQAGS